MPVLHTCFVKATNPGGRLYCGQHDEVRKNGEFGFLGEYITNSHQIREFKAPGDDGGKRMPVVIMQPEMMYDNSRQSLLNLSKFEIEAEKPFVCVPLEEGDKIQITADALTANGGGAAGEDILAKKKRFILTQDKFTLKASGANADDIPGGAGDVYFEIVDIKDAHSRSARVIGKTKQDNYKLYTLEVRVKY